MTATKNCFKPSLISANLSGPLLGNDMTQFSKNTTGQPQQDVQRSLLSRIGEIFAKKREVQSAVAAEQSFSEGISLPSIATENNLSEPLLAQFFSPDGEPTFLSVRRATELPQGVQDQTEFCAVHNYGADRHILSYVLVTQDSGQKILHGYVREFGGAPLVPGPYGPDECPRLLSFEIKSHGAGGAPVILARTASKLAEIFADRGVWGADEYLQQISASIGPSCAFVQRSTRFEKLSGEVGTEYSGEKRDAAVERPSRVL